MTREKVEDVPSQILETPDLFEVVCGRQLETNLGALRGKFVEFGLGGGCCSLGERHPAVSERPYVYDASLLLPLDLSPSEIKPFKFFQRMRSSIWPDSVCYQQLACEYSAGVLAQRFTIDELPEEVVPEISKISFRRRNIVGREEMAHAQIHLRSGATWDFFEGADSLMLNLDGARMMMPSQELREISPQQLGGHGWSGEVDNSNPSVVVFKLNTPSLIVKASLGPLLPDYLERLLVRERQVTQGGLEITFKKSSWAQRARPFPG